VTVVSLTRSPTPSCTEQAVDPAVFFPSTPEQLATAQAVCARCPLTEQCLAGALALGTTDGVWGGVLLERGTEVREKRRPGRPRKVAAPMGAAA
jgi:WhiB family redox-sensing transcriptional regulator